MCEQMVNISPVYIAPPSATYANRPLVLSPSRMENYFLTDGLCILLCKRTAQLSISND